MPVPGAEVRIEPMAGAHAGAVLAIYQAGIDEGDATFETSVPGWTAFTAARLPAHRFVAITAGQVAGWVAASAVSGRCVYAGVVEHSVYVHPGARGRGTGRRLLDKLIASTEAAGIWTIQSGIFPENTASLALHQAAGFRVVGIRERIGQHHGRWRDVILIERRSPAVLPASRQDRPQQPRAETQPDRAGDHGHGHRPPGRRISRQHSDDHESIQRGRADAPGRARPADSPVPGSPRCDSKQRHDRHQRQAGHNAGRYRDRPGPRAAGDQRHCPAQSHRRPDHQQPSGGPAARVRAGELRRDQLRITELGHGGLRRRLGGQSQAQVPPVGFLQPVGQLLHHRAGQLAG
jgi:L-amino acid N-acyltransferase YncA